MLLCSVSGRTLNAFVNRNALEIVNELKDTLGESLSVVFKDIMNNAFGHIPIDLWLLDKWECAVGRVRSQSYGTCVRRQFAQRLEYECWGHSKGSWWRGHASSRLACFSKNMCFCSQMSTSFSLYIMFVLTNLHTLIGISRPWLQVALWFHTLDMSY